MPDYSETQKREMVASFKRWNYRFDLGDGVITEPSRKDHQIWQDIRRELFEGVFTRMLNEHIRGKRFLDIGCNAGYWTHQFLNWGAASALAIDKKPENIQQARFVWDCLHPGQTGTRPVEFRNTNVFDLPEAEGPFDFILALGVLYHFTDPIGFLDKMYRMVNTFIVIDTAVSSINVNEPIMELANGAKYVCCGARERALIPNEAALVSMLRQAGFDGLIKMIPHKTDEAVDGFSQGIRVVLVAFKDKYIP